MRTKDIRCPRCNGVPNSIYYVGLSPYHKYAYAVVECWSGDLKKHSKHHIFFTKIPLLQGEGYNFDEKLAHEIEDILPKEFDAEKYEHITKFLHEEGIELEGENQP